MLPLTKWLPRWLLRRHLDLNHLSDYTLRLQSQLCHLIFVLLGTPRGCSCLQEPWQPWTWHSSSLLPPALPTAASVSLLIHRFTSALSQSAESLQLRWTVGRQTFPLRCPSTDVKMLKRREISDDCDPSLWLLCKNVQWLLLYVLSCLDGSDMEGGRG